MIFNKAPSQPAIILMQPTAPNDKMPDANEYEL